MLGPMGGALIGGLAGGPVVGIEFDGKIVEARNVQKLGGGYRAATHMLVHPTVSYVALLDGAGRISAQNVRRRRPIAPSGDAQS